MLIPYVSKKIEKRTISSFEKKNKTEQVNLLESIIYQQRESLISWIRPWLRDENLEPLTKKKVLVSNWENSLLGIGNQISVKFGVERILAFNEDLKLLSDYRLERNLRNNISDNNDFRELLLKTKDDDAITSGVYRSGDYERKFVVIIPVEHEESEKTFFLTYMIDSRSTLKEFKHSVKYTSVFAYYKNLVHLDEDTDFLEDVAKSKHAKDGIINYNDQLISKRVIKLPNSLIGKDATLQVYVDVTSLIKELNSTKTLVITAISVIVLISLIIFFFMIHFLLKPLDEIVKTSRDVSYGNYDTRCNIKSRNEIGELAKSIDDMLDKITNQNNVNIELTKINAHNAKLASIGELAAGVGHEINNPLAIIQGNLNILTKKFETVPDIDEKYKAYIHKCTLAVSRITNIVKGLRSFSRSDVDNVEYFDIQDSIDEILIMIDDIYTKKGISITYDCADEKYLYELHANRGKFQQVIINLLSNAKDAIEGNDDQKIHILNSSTEDHFKVSIKDNGKGISPDIKEKIFESFFTTKGINKGTGIGLALVANIMKEFNGKIEVESKLDSGSVFTVTFPIKKYTQEEFIQKQIKAKESKEIFEVSIDPTPISGMPFLKNIMIVDDENGILEILKSMFENIQVSANIFDNANDAYNEYISNPELYDLILTDMQMPLMTGSQLIRKIRENTNIKQPEIIIITGGVKFSEENNPENLKEFVHSTISKPFTKHQILTEISELFEIKKSRDAA